MPDWRSFLWRRWINRLADSAVSGRRQRRRSVRDGSLYLERLEDRLVPAVVGIAAVEVEVANQPPVANDDSATTNSNVDVVIDVLANDFDPEGTLAASSLAVSASPSHGTAVVQPANFFVSDDDSPVGDGRASAGSGLVDAAASIELTVSGSPDFEFLGDHTQSGDYALFVRLGQSDFSNFDASVFDFQFTDSLTPGEVDAFRIAEQTPGAPFIAWIDNTVGLGAPDTVMRLLGSPFEIVYIPDPGFDGTDAFSYTVQDSDGLVSNAATVSVTVVNQPPIAGDDRAIIQENAPIIIDVLANDSDPDEVLDPSSLTISTGPVHGTATVQNFSGGSARVRYVPDAAFRGRDVFRYTVRDNDGALSNDAFVAVFVSIEPPKANDDSASIGEGSELSFDFPGIDVLANDFDTDGALDPSSLRLTVPPSHGTAAVDFTVLAFNDTGGLLGDRSGGALPGVVNGSGQFELAVSGSRPFVFFGGFFGGSHEQSGDYALFVRLGESDFANFDPAIFDFQFTDSLTPGDVDFFRVAGQIPGTPFVAWIDNTVASGVPNTAMGLIRRDIRYVPDPGFRGSDTFRYTVQDDEGLVSNEATVTVTVFPVAMNDLIHAKEDAPVAIDVLANDLVGMVDVSSLLISSAPDHGTATVQHSDDGSARVLYVPDAGFQGRDVFRYTVRDTDGVLSNEAVVAVFVFSERPEAGDDSVSTQADTPVRIDVLANDSDVDGTLDASSLTITSRPARGTVTLQDSLVVYTPASATASVLVVDDPTDVNDGDFSPRHLSLREAVFLANGYTDTFRYTVRDEDGLVSQEATVTVTMPPAPTTITFAPGLTAKRRAKLSLSTVADISEGNSALVVTGSVTIVGPAGDHGLTFLGPGQNGDLRLFLVRAGGDLTLQNLTFAHWASDSNGGTIYVQRQGSATLVNCTIRNSFAKFDGGAIFNNGTLTLTDSTLFRNRAQRGGGFMNYGTATLIGSTLANNRAVDGAGFHSGGDTYAGPITLTDCRLSRNEADDRGGGFYLFNATATLTDCTLVGNSAHDGGGIANFGDVSLSHSTIKDNSAINNGGGIYSAPSNSPGQFGGGDHETAVTLEGCIVEDNSAERGGGLFNLSTATLVDCIVTDNEAEQGGGIFHDARNPLFAREHGSLALSGTTLSNNTAEFVGGGLFNNGSATVSTSTFLKNRAKRGGALYNDLGSTALTDCTVTRNVSTRGADLFNHLGVLTLTTSTVTDDSRLAFLSTGAESETRFVANSPDRASRGVAAPAKRDIVTGPDGIRYALTSDRELLRQLPESSWAVLDDGVEKYKIAPNGDCYWQNDRREVYRAQAGYAGNILGAGVRGFEMEPNGTVYEISSFVSPASFARYRSLTAPLLDAVEEPIDSFDFCLDPPTPDEILQAARFAAPFADNIRIVVEPIVDTIDTPRYFPNVGLARMHVCQYKCTIYFDARTKEFPINHSDPSEAVIYIDRNHLHRYVPGELSASGLPRVAAKHAAADISASGGELSAASATASRSFATLVRTSPADDLWVAERYAGGHSARSLASAPDGTIYQWGSDPDGKHGIGLDAPLLVLHRLSPGQNWEGLFGVRHFAVASDSTLYTLNGLFELQSLRSGSTDLTTLEIGVASFSLAPDGTLYALNANHELRRLLPGSEQLTTIDRGVQSFSMAPDGTLYQLNDRQELKRLNASGRWSILDRGVQSFSMADDGTLYELNGRQELKKLTGGVHWSVLDVGVQSFTRAVDGTVYALDDRHQLKRLTARDHWMLLDVGVQSFIVMPNVFQVVYVLNDNHELKVSETGEPWITLRTDVVFLTIDADFPISVRAIDTIGRIWLYDHGTSAPPILDEIEPNAVVFCLDPPSPDEVSRRSGIEIGAGRRFGTNLFTTLTIVRVIVEPTFVEVDPARIFPYVGPAQMHHCHYRATIFYDDSEGPHELVLFLDHDHLIRAPFGV